MTVKSVVKNHIITSVTWTWANWFLHFLELYFSVEETVSRWSEITRFLLRVWMCLQAWNATDMLVLCSPHWVSLFTRNAPPNFTRSWGQRLIKTWDKELCKLWPTWNWYRKWHHLQVKSLWQSELWRIRDCLSVTAGTVVHSGSSHCESRNYGALRVSLCDSRNGGVFRISLSVTVGTVVGSRPEWQDNNRQQVVNKSGITPLRSG